MNGERSARALLGFCTVAFLVVGDLWFPPGSPWHHLRLPLLGAAIAAALAVTARRPQILRTLGRFPLVFFSVFAGLDLVASMLAERPLPSLRYAAGYVAVEILAVAIAAVFSERAIVRGLLFAVGVKLVASLAFAPSPIAWWTHTRFMGLLGSPNPMGAAAGLAYLLIVLHGWYDWPRKPIRVALVAGGLAATTTMAVTQSLSALGATLATLVCLAPLGRVRESTRRERVAWAVVVVAALAPLLMITGGGGGMAPRPTTPTQAVVLRSGWWGMLQEAVWRHPWLGYGAGSTPSLGIAGAPYWGTSAHNLYLEAAVYAGVPAALVMMLFMASALFAAVARVCRAGGGVHVGLAVPMVFYAALSLVEPVLLNGVPSSLVAPLIVAAVCALRVSDRP